MAIKQQDLRPVILLHGLGRSAHSMYELSNALIAADFQPYTVDYPSRQMSIQEAADFVERRIERDLDGQTLFAVTHSLGGVVLRHIRKRFDWRRIVMLAPPNNGSAAAMSMLQTGLDFVTETFKRAFGPAAGELGSATQRERPFPFPPAPFAVIAGTRPVSMTSVISGRALGPDVEHDGTVTVEETKLPGMSDFATVHVGHTDIMNHPETIRLTTRFLERGTFRRGVGVD